MGKPNNNTKKRLLWVFSPYCVPKWRNTCKELYEKKKKDYQIRVSWMFLILLGTTNSKVHAKHPIWEKKRTLPKTCLISVFFFLFSFLRTKTLKRMENTLYGESEQHDQKHVFWVFSCLVFTKTPKCLQNTLFGVTKGLYQKRVIWVFLSVLGNKTQNSI